MADLSDFLNVDFSRLVADPNGFELGLAPLGRGEVTAVRLRTGKGSGTRELSTAELTALLQRFLGAIGGGTIMAEFDPEEYATQKQRELDEIRAQILTLRRREKRVAVELRVMSAALAKLEALDHEKIVARVGGTTFAAEREARIVAYVKDRPEGVRAAELAHALDVKPSVAAAALVACVHKSLIQKLDRGLFGPLKKSTKAA